MFARLLIAKLLPPILPVTVIFALTVTLLNAPVPGVTVPMLPLTLPNRLPASEEALKLPVNIRLPALILPTVVILPALKFPVADMGPVLTILDPVTLVKVALAGNSMLIVPLLVIGLPATVNDWLVTSILDTVPTLGLIPEIVIAPVLPLNDIPGPAVSLVTPVLTILMVPESIIGLPVTLIPSPAVIAILVTVPAVLMLLMPTILPYWSIVNVGLTYVPGLKLALVGIAGNSITIFPLLMIGLPLIFNVVLRIPTLVTPATTLVKLPLTLIVISPLLLFNVIPVPEVSLVTPVFVIETELLVGLVTNIPVPPLILTYGLALANKFSKLVSTLVKALYKSSEPVA